jgi:6-phosphogluconolactonase
LNAERGGESLGGAVRWHVLADGAELVAEACARIRGAAGRSIAAHGRFRIVLAGGTTPAAIYRMLGQSEGDWSHWHLYLGDERCLPEGDSGRNIAMIREALLDAADIPSAQVYEIPAELGPQEAARNYEPVVADALPFDLVLLGVGEDGHTASLFPGLPRVPGAAVQAVHGAPKPPSERVSLSAQALACTRELLVIATGAGKRDALRRWRRGESLPIAEIRPTAGLDVLVDRAAWGEQEIEGSDTCNPHP